jgi:hypothetical protein
MAGRRAVKKKKKRLSAASEARRRARKSAPAPSAERVIPDKRKRPEKHRKRWMEREESFL